MNKFNLMILALWSMALCAASAADEPAPPPSPYEVVWDSPSQDYNGTMSLGTLNARLAKGLGLRLQAPRAVSDCY
jgi:hypothetical protein